MLLLNTGTLSKLRTVGLEILLMDKIKRESQISVSSRENFILLIEPLIYFNDHYFQYEYSLLVLYIPVFYFLSVFSFWVLYIFLFGHFSLSSAK